MFNKKVTILLLTVALLVLTSALQVAAFTYFVEVVNNTITKEETAVFKLTIRNTAEYNDYFTISTRDVNWLISSDPASGFVGANDEEVFTISIRPKILVPEGKTYFIPIKIKSEQSEFYFEEREKFAIYLVTPDMRPGVYAPTVVPVLSIDKLVDPREKVAVKVILKNRNARQLNDLKVVVNGEVFYKEYYVDLLPLEEKTNEVLFEINPLTEPGTKTLTLQLFFRDAKVAQSSIEYEIQGYVDLKETASKSTVLFRARESYTMFNNGNKPGVAEKDFRVGIIEKIFTRITPAAEKEKGEDGKKYYVVKRELAPQQGIEIIKVTNYRSIVLILIIIIIAAVLYFLLRSPVIVIKNAEPLSKTHDGVSEIKVRLYLKNRTGRAVNNLRVIDIVPSIAELERKTHLGSMEPVSVGKSKRGTIPRWEMEALEAYEERIITYRIKSKLPLIGGIRLPSAKATFETMPGQQRTTYSNSLNMVYHHREE